MVYFIYYLLNCFNLDFYELLVKEKIRVVKNKIVAVIKSRCTIVNNLFFMLYFVKIL